MEASSGRRIVLPGGSGHLGTHLARRLVARGDEVVVLTRGSAGMRHGVRHVRWDGTRLGPWVRTLDGADAVVHLAGKRVDAAPTRRNVDELIRSRAGTVRLVGRALAEVATPPPVWVQASTLAIHGDAGDRLLDDGAAPDGLGPRQMTTVALAWEHAFLEATAGVDRRVLLRLGVSLGGGDPALARLRQLVRLGLGGTIASGRQWVSWLALEDALALFVRALDDATMSGTYVATSPNPVTNAELMAMLRRHEGRRLGLPAPRAAVHVGTRLLGTDPALPLTSRRGVPSRLLAEGFRFGVPHLEEALRRADG